jgi:radical SAM protein with 4Fe4S-binding SPASM domain
MEFEGIPLLIENVPFRKLCNWFATGLATYVKPENPWGWPLQLQIEATNRCNLHCPLCPVTENLDRPNGNMDRGQFRKVIDEIGDNLFILYLWNWGEPFLNPAIYEMIAYARGKGIKVVTDTNGHLFGEREAADKLIQSGLDILSFSVDGITQQSYEAYRRGGDLETVLQGIRMIVARKRALKSPTPFLTLRFMVMRHNEHELPQLEAFSRSLGVDALVIKKMNPVFRAPYGEKEAKGQEAAFLPKDSRYLRFAYDPASKTAIKVRRNPCRNLWNSATISWDGMVSPCCCDPDGNYSLGNINETAFKSIWHGAPYRRMRSLFSGNWEQIPICRECSNAYQGGEMGSAMFSELFLLNNERGIS